MSDERNYDRSVGMGSAFPRGYDPGHPPPEGPDRGRKANLAELVDRLDKDANEVFREAFAVAAAIGVEIPNHAGVKRSDDSGPTTHTARIVEALHMLAGARIVLERITAAL